MYYGTLKSAKAVRKFSDGISGREFRVVRADGKRLHPFEAADLDWQHNGVFVNSKTADELDLMRVSAGGELKLYAFDGRQPDGKRKS